MTSTRYQATCSSCTQSPPDLQSAFGEPSQTITQCYKQFQIGAGLGLAIVNPEQHALVRAGLRVPRLKLRFVGESVMAWKPKDTVIVPVDFSDSSVPAIQEALAVASGPESVHVIHVLPHLEQLSPGVVLGTTDDESRLKHATTYLGTWLGSNEIDGVRQRILIGDPGAMIVEYAGKARADLIVIPSHGFHGMKRMLLGSVAERVIRHADCAVYVLRRTDAE